MCLSRFEAVGRVPVLFGRRHKWVLPTAIQKIYGCINDGLCSPSI